MAEDLVQEKVVMVEVKGAVMVVAALAVEKVVVA